MGKDLSTEILTPAQLDILERRMQEEHDRASARIASFKKQFDGIVAHAEGSPPDDEHDPEGATIAFERAQVSDLLAQSEKQLVRIESALARLADGSYGYCEACRRPVPFERMEARPATRTCAACAST